MRQQFLLCTFAVIAVLLVQCSDAGLAQRRYRSAEIAATSEDKKDNALENHIPVTIIKDTEIEKEAELEKLPTERKVETPAELSEPALKADLAEAPAKALPEAPAATSLESEQALPAAKLEDAKKIETDAALPALSTDTAAADAALPAAPLIPIEKEKEADLPKPTDEIAEEAQPNLRQAAVTVPTPTQGTTQQNFVQFLQNSPVGQFLSQLTGQNQQQQQAAGGQVAADEPATPQPTVPGFLNPSAAITSAQQALQNAAQSVVNSTQQAFQGVQQFANNLGSQFQNTLSNLGGQQPQQVADSTTPRPPGPLQSLISFFQGNNRPQAGQVQAAPAVTPLPILPAPAVNDKIDNNRRQDEQQQQQPLAATPNAAPAAEPAAAPAPAAEPAASDNQGATQGEEAIADIAPEPNTGAELNNNELRNSNEVADDSFEEPGNLIVVDDDAAAAESSVRSAVVVPEKEVVAVAAPAPVAAVDPVVPVVPVVPVAEVAIA